MCSKQQYWLQSEVYVGSSSSGHKLPGKGRIEQVARRCRGRDLISGGNFPLLFKGSDD